MLTRKKPVWGPLSSCKLTNILLTLANDLYRCYTNHALDQFLEHLIEIGIEKVIRIGSKSKSTQLEGKNLRVASQGESSTKSEKYLLAKAYQALETHEHIITKLLGRLHGSQKRRGWASLEHYMRRTHPRIHSQFNRFDEDGFETVGRDPFDIWVEEKLPALSKEPENARFPPELIQHLLAQATNNVNLIAVPNRRRLAEYWTEQIRSETTDELFEMVMAADCQYQALSKIHDDVDRRVLQTAEVIGVTTTGLARRIATLQNVTCKVVICEEAGEVMEPHLISAFLPSVEHFIQIGDHQQLRPQINNFQLSLESQRGTFYQLDRSQFERLSVGERGRPAFPVAQLSVQRRMRPEISTLIRETMYPRLVDHDDTKNLPDVVGMRKNVFWLDHNNIEEGAQADRHQKSHSNLWEVDMTHALVRHIVRQGVYSSTDIAVLTPYTGQLQKLRAKMRNDFEVVLSERDEETLIREGFNEVENSSSESEDTSNQVNPGIRPLKRKMMTELLRVATVDNFQGEEAKVVIVSLVRSNKEKKVGFLKTNNRINVLLSRAQHGLYLIGNTDTYLIQNMWASVHGMLQAIDSVGKALELCCPRHIGTKILVSQPDDFARLSPEGGCQLVCDRRLADCGHRCQARCHSEGMHQVFSCPQPCRRLHDPCKHNCQKQTCGEDCGPCLISIDNVLLPCDHSADRVPCHLTQDVGKIECTVLMRKQIKECKHTVEVQCCKDVNLPSFSCPSACLTILSCGHQCPGTCGRCNRKDGENQTVVKHVSCSKPCGRRFGACNHNCRRPCHDGKDCGPCLSPCEVSNFHVTACYTSGFMSHNNIRHARILASAISIFEVQGIFSLAKSPFNFHSLTLTSVSISFQFYGVSFAKVSRFSNLKVSGDFVCRELPGIPLTFHHLKSDKLLTKHRLSVRILDVTYDVMNHVRRVWRIVLGLANTRGNVTCRAQHHVVVSHAISAAPESYPVDTSALDSVVKRVPRTSARHVPFIKKLKSTSSK